MLPASVPHQSTWGGNFTDFVRSTHYLRIIEKERLVDNARVQGEHLLVELIAVARKHSILQAVRGRGLMLAFDLPTPALRDAFWKGAYELGLLAVRSGERTIRLRPMLDVQADTIRQAVALIEKECRKLES